MSDDQRRAVSFVLTTAADTLPVWRDAAVVILACVVIGCLLLISAVVEP